MVNDLMRHYQLVGLPRSKVIGLLGEPVPTSKIAEHVARGFKEDIRGDDAMYWLGVRNIAFNWNAEWLLVRFDAGGVVSECKILHDDTRRPLNITSNHSQSPQ